MRLIGSSAAYYSLRLTAPVSQQTCPFHNCMWWSLSNLPSCCTNLLTRLENVKQIVTCPGSVTPRQASLEQPLVADHKTERTETRRQAHSLPGLPHHFLPVRASSLLPGYGPHTEPTCFAMQCFYTGTKCQLAKSICAPPFLLRKGRRLTNRKRGEREQDGKKKVVKMKRM